MDKLKAFLDRWQLQAETRRKPKYPPVVFDILWEIYRELKTDGHCTFFQTDVKAILEKCGLTVEPWDEVSWVVRNGEATP